jgi:cobalt/nickel transport system permease protein
MHMGNELLSSQVGGALLVISGGALAYAARKTRTELNERVVPMMGVMGAFVFAAQMINFPVLADTSGHLGGGTMLAILLGPHAAAIVMGSVLIVQCLIFQDGGLLALGANILNMALIPAYIGYAVYCGIRLLLPSHRGAVLAAFIATLWSVVLGAVLVPVEVSIAGIYQVPVLLFVGLMAGVHLLIGVVEAGITVGVLGYIQHLRPDLLDWRIEVQPRISFKKFLAGVVVVTLILAGGISYFASSHPDGLEWVVNEHLALPGGAAEENAGDDTGLFSGYDIANQKIREEHPMFSKGVAGAVGAVMTITIVMVVGAMARIKKEGID